MAAFFARRLCLAIAVLFSVTIITFTLTNVATDPALAIAGAEASPEQVAEIRRQYGFDRPISTRYVEWLSRVARGDFGKTNGTAQDIAPLIGDRIGRTMLLGACATAFAILIGIPLGVVAATRPNSWVDRFALILAVTGQAVPSFWLALMFIIFFGVNLQVLPISGFGTWQHLVLPVVVLGTAVMPGIMRLTRSSMIEVLSSPFIRTCRAKGLSAGSIVFKHALRNALIPVVALAAVQFGHLLGGSVLVEAIFAIPGIGYLAWEAVLVGDQAIIQAIVLIVATIYVTLTAASDLLNAYLDPRIRLG